MMTAPAKKRKTTNKKAKAEKPEELRSRVLHPLTTRDRIRLMARSLADARTIRKWARGDQKIRTVTAMRLERACAELGIELRA